MIKEFALQWPVLRQIFQGGDGTGPEAMSPRRKTFGQRMKARKWPGRYVPTARWAAVNCFSREGKLISIEGDPESPVSRGRLCPKGCGQLRAADAFQTADQNKISPPILQAMGRAGSRQGNGDDRGSSLGEPRTNFR